MNAPQGTFLNGSTGQPGRDQPTPASEILEPDTLARLEELALTLGLTINGLIHQLIDKEPAHTSKPHAPPSAITEKQQAVLDHLKAGLSVKEIADRMDVSEHTIRTHIIRARIRLDCPDLLSMRFRVPEHEESA